MTLRWWLLLSGTCVISVAAGVLGTLAVIEFTDDDGFYSKTDPGAARWFCEDTEIVAVATTDEHVVNIQVTLQDELGRTWDVRLGDGSAAILRAGNDGRYAGLTVASGDLDDGPERRVRLRPAGAESWCVGTVSLT